ncbi:MAG: hypothetical protein JXA42_16960 [Anaerolineales bacterium]|nr:hypothetical protein [Anaerolineales bacterium]
MRKFRWNRILALWACLLMLAGCNGNEGVETPAAIEDTAAEQIVFTAPFRAVLDKGETVPGAQLEYVNQDDDGIHVRIEGEDAVKKVGDSFNWSGSPATGVELDYGLRVLGVFLGVFQAWGTVDIIIPEPFPLVAELPEEAPLVFTAAVASYQVEKDQIIPGTTIIYLGKSEKGAEFGGVEGYRYREIADSLDWSGQLRSNIFVDLTMRVKSIDEDKVDLVGTATIWILD